MAVCGKGIPIGNLTSQLFANIYMNEFDQFVKHKLKVKYYCRYTDDFVIIDNEQIKLEKLIPNITEFLGNKLKLELHSRKVTIRKLRQGIDFLGYVVLPHYRLVRTKTRRRIFKKLKHKVYEHKTDQINGRALEQSLSSYLGVLSHANAYRLKQSIKDQLNLL